MTTKWLVLVWLKSELNMNVNDNDLFQRQVYEVRWQFVISERNEIEKEKKNREIRKFPY